MSSPRSRCGGDGLCYLTAAASPSTAGAGSARVASARRSHACARPCTGVPRCSCSPLDTCRSRTSRRTSRRGPGECRFDATCRSPLRRCRVGVLQRRHRRDRRQCVRDAPLLAIAISIPIAIMLGLVVDRVVARLDALDPPAVIRSGRRRLRHGARRSRPPRGPPGAPIAARLLPRQAADEVSEGPIERERVAHGRRTVARAPTSAASSPAAAIDAVGSVLTLSAPVAPVARRREHAGRRDDRAQVGEHRPQRVVERERVPGVPAVAPMTPACRSSASESSTSKNDLNSPRVARREDRRDGDEPVGPRDRVDDRLEPRAREAGQHVVHDVVATSAARRLDVDLDALAPRASRRSRRRAGRRACGSTRAG